MCKIATFTDASKLDVKQTVNKIGNILLDLEPDGFGYAVAGESGIFGEKCIDRRFFSRLGSKPNPKKAIKKKYELFGSPSKATGPMILHGRTSTNFEGLINTHPMVKDEHYLIHNGVVTDHGPKYAKATGNDSEDVLHRFLGGIEHVEKNLTGYYAFSCIAPDGKLHVVRDSIAELYIGWLPKLETYLIATTPELLKRIADLLKTKLGPVDEVRDNVYMIFNGNEIEHCQDIVSRGWERREAQYASLSLGREIIEYNSGKTTVKYEPENSVFNDSALLESSNGTIDEIDETYEIYDQNDREITFLEFCKLDPVSKLQCFVVRPNGTVIDFMDKVG